MRKALENSTNRLEIMRALRKFAKANELQIKVSRFGSVYLEYLDESFFRVSDHSVSAKTQLSKRYMNDCISDIEVCPSYDHNYDYTVEKVLAEIARYID